MVTSTGGQDATAIATGRRMLQHHCISCLRPRPQATLSRAQWVRKGTMPRGAQPCTAAGAGGGGLIAGLQGGRVSGSMTAGIACGARMRILHSWCLIGLLKAVLSWLQRLPPLQVSILPKLYHQPLYACYAAAASCPCPCCSPSPVCCQQKARVPRMWVSKSSAHMHSAALMCTSEEMALCLGTSQYVAQASLSLLLMCQQSIDRSERLV